ncbi:MAG: low molecular weight phosphotyrosine protein phosphatase [Betaproteobacteria bacterium]|nr:low molecular weight phosphotyrosine protein phosphatase [Betaproteobacteria bacterium]MDH4293707.1 low molecular weight phosphotyrosine protein phosphatase [Betaproteobacteria bacterium]MDH5344095.1 low molecular weight phosphotyrosine protein phosphatase [Betaproteobacteria bacterium]
MGAQDRSTGVLFVCMGNICRSPTAEGVFRHLLEQQGMTEQVLTDSAGTHDYHIGAPPDLRAQAAAARRGYDLSMLRARQVTPADFERFDYVLAMDEANLGELLPLCPDASRDRLRLLLEFAEEVERRDVPDPYYGGEQGFEDVLDLVENAARGLLAHIKNNK